MQSMHSWLVFFVDQERILNVSSPIQAKGSVDIQLAVENKIVRILFIISDYVLIFLITCSFYTQYKGVWFSLYNSPDV